MKFQGMETMVFTAECGLVITASGLSIKPTLEPQPLDLSLPVEGEFFVFDMDCDK